MGERKGWVGLFGAGCLTAAAIVGCSAAGSTDESGLALEPTEPTPSAALPPSAPTPPPTDAGAPAKDAGKKPKTPPPPVDAGPPPPAPGDACTTPDAVFQRMCGKCGTQEALCQSNGKVSDYGPCEGEAGECVAGTTEEVACGNCGKQTRTCDNTCSWTMTACAGEPANSCSPGGVDLVTAGCTTTNTFKSRTCSETCQYGNYSDSCSAPPTMVRVAPTPGQVNSTYLILKSTQTMPSMSGPCATATLSTYTTTAPYQYMTVRNPNSKPTKVTISTSAAPNGSTIGTTIAVYDGVVAPTDLAGRKACAKGFAYGSKIDEVVVQPGATISVFVGTTSNYNAASPASTTGRIQFSVQTDELL